MNPGHEDCWRASLTPDGFSRGGILPHTPQCDRAHLEPIQADDRIGTGPIVADYCNCCGTMHRRPEYQ